MSLCHSCRQVPELLTLTRDKNCAIDRTAHAQYYLVYNFAQAILHDEELKSKPALHKVMTTCFELFACYTMDAEASEFLSSGYLSPKQAELLRNRVHALLAELRPQAVSLVDAWGVPDYLLNSALGRYDGQSTRVDAQSILEPITDESTPFVVFPRR